MDLESTVASFRAGATVATAGEALLLPNWRDQDWNELSDLPASAAWRRATR
jgi:hypothetical protein